jgi:hypothetical protein
MKQSKSDERIRGEVTGAPARFRGASQLGDVRLMAADAAVVPDSMAARDMKKRLPADADMMTVRLPEGLLERTKIRAIKEKATLQSLVAAALENYLKQPLVR